MRRIHAASSSEVDFDIVYFRVGFLFAIVFYYFAEGNSLLFEQQQMLFIMRLCCALSSDWCAIFTRLVIHAKEVVKMRRQFTRTNISAPIDYWLYELASGDGREEQGHPNQSTVAGECNHLGDCALNCYRNIYKWMQTNTTSAPMILQCALLAWFLLVPWDAIVFSWGRLILWIVTTFWCAMEC